MRYCKRCLYPENHPLNLTFDAEGVCSGCRVHEEKDTLDWRVREGRLARILDQFRDRSGRNFDCVVPVSGARDSYFIVHTLVKRYGLKPLFVSYNRHHNTERGIRNLAYLRTNFDGDYMQQVVAPQTIKRVTREIDPAHRLALLARACRPDHMAGAGCGALENPVDRLGRAPGARSGRHVLARR